MGKKETHAGQPGVSQEVGGEAGHWGECVREERSEGSSQQQ